MGWNLNENHHFHSTNEQRRLGKTCGFDQLL